MGRTKLDEKLCLCLLNSAIGLTHSSPNRRMFSDPWGTPPVLDHVQGLGASGGDPLASCGPLPLLLTNKFLIGWNAWKRMLENWRERGAGTSTRGRRERGDVLCFHTNPSRTKSLSWSPSFRKHWGCLGGHVQRSTCWPQVSFLPWEIFFASLFSSMHE